MPTLTDAQFTTLATRARDHIAASFPSVTVTVTRDAPEFQTIVAELPDEMAVALFLDGPHVIAAPTPEPLQAPEEPRDGAQIAQWVAEGQEAYRKGVARDALGEGKRRLKHRQAGWDHAKAEAEAALSVPEQNDIEAELEAGDRLLCETVAGGEDDITEEAIHEMGL